MRINSFDPSGACFNKFLRPQISNLVFLYLSQFSKTLSNSSSCHSFSEITELNSSKNFTELKIWSTRKRSNFSFNSLFIFVSSFSACSVFLSRKLLLSTLLKPSKTGYTKKFKLNTNNKDKTFKYNLFLKIFLNFLLFFTNSPEIFFNVKNFYQTILDMLTKYLNKSNNKKIKTLNFL